MKVSDVYALSLFLGGCLLFGASAISDRRFGGYLLIGLLIFWISSAVLAIDANDNRARFFFCAAIVTTLLFTMSTMARVGGAS